MLIQESPPLYKTDHKAGLYPYPLLHQPHHHFLYAESQQPYLSNQEPKWCPYNRTAFSPRPQELLHHYL